MGYDKDEIKANLDTITKYLYFIINLNNKYIHEKSNVRNELVLNELIYYSEGTLKRLCKAFDFILDNFKYPDNNYFLVLYRILRLGNMISIEKICRDSLEMISGIETIKEIFETILRVINNPATSEDKLYLQMMNADDD